MQNQEIQEWRVGRNYVRVGDIVKVTPSRPNKRDGFEAKVTKIIEVDGEVTEVEVVNKRGFRTFRPDRIQRLAQTVHGEDRELVR